MNRFRKKNGQKGFTMIELMVVVVIVGILAAIAIPIYGKYIKNARMTEATGRIGEIITAEKAYAQEKGVYTDHQRRDRRPERDGELHLRRRRDRHVEHALTITATGTNKMASAEVVYDVPSIHQAGTITTRTLP